MRRKAYGVFNIILKVFALFFYLIQKYCDLTFMKGSVYFDIFHDLVEYVLKQKRLIRKMFRFTVCCDKVFLHTISYNSVFRENITFYGTRFIDGKKHNASPEILTLEHYDEIK